MKISSIRSQGKRVKEALLRKVCKTLSERTVARGYVTHIAPIDNFEIIISNNLRLFTIDSNKLGYNAEYLNNESLVWRKSITPTWDQRVDFNNIVNDVLDEFKLEANVRSGFFVVRTKSFGRAHQNSQPTTSVNVSFFTPQMKLENKERKQSFRSKYKPIKKDLIKYMQENGLTLAHLLIDNSPIIREAVSKFNWGNRHEG